MEYTSIGESCSVVSGGTPSRSKNEYWENGNIPWIKIGNIKSKYVNEYDELITEQGLNNSSAKLLKKGTILYTIFATLGEVGILDIEACTNQAIAGINITDPRITTDYLYYYLKSKKDYVNNIGRGVAQNNINLTTLKNFEIPLIDVDKQLNIVEILEKVERMICLKEKEIDDLDLLIKARFIEMFGDGNSPIKTVKELCYCVVDCPHTTPKYEGNLKNPAIRTSEIKKGFLVWDTMRYVSDKEYVERTTRAIPKAGDIVYGREGTFGNAAILPDGYKFCLGQRVMLLRPDYSKCTSEYLLHSVISDEVYRQAIEKNNASTVAHVNVKDVKQFKVPLPSLDKQNEFANFVKQVDKSRFDIKKSIIELEREVVYD